MTVGELTRSRWVTRARPKIDRIACPWRILRFIDPKAEFFFVPPDEVASACKRLNARAFDVPGVQFTHRAERCSFDAFIEDFGLKDPGLDDVARIVRGADTGRLDLAPESAGLLVISLGLSRHILDDNELLKAGLHLYDGLYVWAREARGESHSWPPASA